MSQQRRREALTELTLYRRINDRIEDYLTKNPGKRRHERSFLRYAEWRITGTGQEPCNLAGFITTLVDMWLANLDPRFKPPAPDIPPSFGKDLEARVRELAEERWGHWVTEGIKYAKSLIHHESRQPNGLSPELAEFVHETFARCYHQLEDDIGDALACLPGASCAWFDAAYAKVTGRQK